MRDVYEGCVWGYKEGACMKDMYGTAGTKGAKFSCILDDEC